MNTVPAPFFKKYAAIFSIALVLFLSAQAVLAAGHLKVFYVRHGQSGANVAKLWKDVAKAEWPVYVGNEDTFTPKGDSEVVALTPKLQGMKFDFIAVSPKWRTRHTILPYLKAAGIKAEIWPELIETKKVPPEHIGATDIPAFDKSLFAGDSIRLQSDEVPFFSFKDGARLFPKFAKDTAQAIAQALALGRETVKLIKERFSGKDESILLVGHGNAGSTLIRLLTGQMEFDGLKNTGIWEAEEQADGSFRLEMLNNKPFKEEMIEAK